MKYSWLQNDISVCTKKLWSIRTKRKLGKTTTPKVFHTGIVLKNKNIICRLLLQGCSTLLKPAYIPLTDLGRTEYLEIQGVFLLSITIRKVRVFV